MSSVVVSESAIPVELAGELLRTRRNAAPLPDELLDIGNEPRDTNLLVTRTVLSG